MPQNALICREADRKPSEHISQFRRASPGLPDEDKANCLAARLKKATKPIMVQIAPYKYVPFDQNKTTVPEVSLCRWQPNTDGTYFPLPFEERMIRLDKKLLKCLGLAGQYRTIRRLGQMGCIEIVQIAPRVILLNLSSWFNHLRRCAENPFLWDEDGAYIKEYRKILD